MKLISFLILILLLTSQALMAANPAIIWGSGGYADNLAPTGIRMKSGSVIDDTGAGIEVNDLSVLGNFSLSNGYLIDEILDEDDMLSDSDTAVPTQQSVKAYVDSYTLDTPNTFAWFDALGVLNTLPGWQVSTVSGGAQVYLNYEADTGVGPFYNRLHSFETELTSLAASPDDNVFAVVIDTYIDRANNNFDIQGDVTNFQNLLSIENGNNYGNMSSSYTQVNTVNEAGVAGNISLDDRSVNISPLFTVGNINLANASATIDGVAANVTGAGTYVTGDVGGQYIGVDSSLSGNVAGNYYGENMSFVGDVTSDYRAINANHTGDVGGNYSGVNIYQSGQTNGMSGFQFNKSGSDVGGSIKAVDINIATASTNNAMDAIFIGDGSVTSGAKSGVNVQLTGEANVMTGVNVFANLDGAVPTYTGVNNGTNLAAGSTVNALIGSVSSLNNVAGTVSGYAIGQTVSLTGAFPDPVGLEVSVFSATSTTANGPVSLRTDGGVVNIGSIHEIATGAGVQIGNLNHIQSSTTTDVSGTDYIAQAHPTTFDISHDVAAGPLGMGLTGFGYLDNVGVDATKTVADFNMITAGTGNGPSTGGTITQATGFNSLGMLNFGGTLSVDEFAHIRVRPGSLGTDIWGISIEDPTAENYLDKSLVIGGGTKQVSNADVALEIADEKPLLFAPVDTVTRNAWTALEGMFTYNEDDVAPNYYDGTNWQIVASQDYVGAVDLQTVYDQSTSGDIVVDGTIDGVSIRDNATPIAATLFEVTDNAGTGNYLSVDATGMALNSGVTVDSILDEDDLVSDSDTAIPTQQSVKAYVDSRPQGKNYVGNPTPRIDTAGWTRYATSTPSATPIDFAGIPAAYPTWTRNTTNALNNVSDFLLQKDPSDRQGEGIYYEFDIENGDKTVMQLLQFYKLDDLIYEDGDIAIFVVTSDDNFTTQNIIYPANQDMLAGIPTVFKQFQFNSTDTKGRLCIHIASNNVFSYNVQFNDFALAQSPVATSAVVLDGEEYTPTFTGFGTPTNVDVRWSRVGNKLKLEGRFTGGTTTAVEARISLPSGLVSASTISTLEIAGVYGQSTNATVSGYVTREPSVSYITFSTQFSTGNALTKALGNGMLGTGASLSFFAEIPIEGWSSNAASSIDLGARDIVLNLVGSGATQSITDNSATKATNWTVSEDTVAGWDSVNSRYSISEGGYFDISASAIFSSDAGNDVASQRCDIYKNGSLLFRGEVGTNTLIANRYQPAVNVTAVRLEKGDYLEVFVYQDNSSGNASNLTGATTSQWLQIAKKASPQTILAAQAVYGNYTKTDAQAIANNTVTSVIWNTTVETTNANWMNTSTGELTVGENGNYQFNAGASLVSATSGTGVVFLEIYKNGTRVSRGVVNGIDDGGAGSSVSHSMYCNKNDVITTRIVHTNGVSRNLSTTAGLNTFSYHRTN